MKNPRRYRALIIVAVVMTISLIWLARNRWQPHTITEITQKIASGGGGLFPSYKVILRPHQSIYIGDLYAPMRGTWESDDVDFGFCVRVLRQCGFFSFGRDYTGYASDVGKETISAAYPGGRKTVSADSGAGPKQLSDLGDQIDQAVAKAHWHKVSSSMDYPPDD